MKTILVSGASGIVGYGVLKSLRQADAGCRLIGTSIYTDSVAPAFCDVFEQAPPTTDKSYITWLLGIIKKHQVNMIIPGIDVDMQVWNDARGQLEKSGATPLLNNSELIRLCSDKWAFYERLQESDSSLAIESRLDGDFATFSKDFGLPFLLKPRRGFASKGIVRVNDEAVFSAQRHQLGTLVMAQPIVGTDDAEYTVSAFFDSASKLRAHMGLKRKLSKEGFTEKAQVATPDGAAKAMQALAALLHPVGPTNFQFRVHKGRLKLLEINPRISSATSIRTAFGYNESKMSVEYFLDNIVPEQPKVRAGYAVRYTEDSIFYDSPDI